uniref:Extended synaptotagmin-1-like n=1 Tax=Sinocyclocheilus anshuiensis TaxID=1608454 RepID=A0A671KAW1_9TELE
MSRVDAGPKNDSDSEKKTEPAQDSSLGEMDVPKTKLFDAKAILWTFGKCLTALLPVYLAGYYRMSTSLVVFGMMVYAGWKHSREAKEARLKSAIELVNDKEEYISSKSFRSRRDLPSWVRMHKSVSFVIQQAWPFIGQYLEKLLTETIAPSIRGSSTHLQTLCFTKVDFGGKPMKVVGVKAHTENEKGQILLDVYISYVGDVEINVEVKRYFCKAGVKGIQLHGMMRVILEPLIGDVPIVGAVTMFFIQRPVSFSKLIQKKLNKAHPSIIKSPTSYVILPKLLPCTTVGGKSYTPRMPRWRGVVRIHLLEADGLASKDNYVKGVMVGMSDPYALLRVGPQTFKSRHLDNTLNPKWDEMYEVIAHEVPGQELEVEVFDKDADHDDFLGRTKLDLGIVKKSKIVDEWFTLKDTRTGRVHLRLEWLTLEADTERLEEVTPISCSWFAPPSIASCICVCVQMKKGNKDPNPIVQISVQDVTHDSRICWNTVNPQWEDAFTFFIRDPSKQDISIQVKDNDRVQDLGSLSIPVSRLLSCQDLNLDEWFNLENSGPESRIHINTVLRGMLRIHLVEGQNLVAKDNMMGGMVKGKSDPYVKIQIGGETFKSQVIKENLSPTWNEMYELPGQELTLEVFDKDMDMKDDFMGRLKMNLSDIISSQYINESKSSYLNKTVPTAALLFVYVERAHELPVCDRTSSPRWDEAFHFLVQDPLNEDLVVKLTHNWDFSLGSVVILVKELLSEPDLMLDQWLDLDGASPQSQILLRAQLKVEHTQVSSSDDLRPLHTIPDPSFGAEGVLRLHLLEAEDLVAKDNMMGRMVKGKSDPYVKIHIGDTVFKSYVIKENLNPTWNEMYELVMTSTSTSDVLVEVFDKDVDQDDFLGRMKISLQDIIQSQLTDKWFSLSDVKHGRVHMVLEWLPTVTQPDGLQKALQLQSEHSYQNKSVPSAALFFILLERAHDLPLKKSGKEPKAAAELVLGDISHKTKVCDRSTSPEWSEAFHFLIHNPTEEILIIKLSSAFEQPLGSVVLPIRELLSKPDLLMDQWLSLDGAGPDTQILLRAQLKILDSSLDTSVLHRKKPVVEEEHSVSEQREEKAPIAVEHSQAAVSKDSEKKTLPTKGLSELAAFTLPVPATLPEEHQKPMSDAHHTPSVPKTLLDTEDLSNVPDSTTSEGGCMEPVKTFGSAHEEQKHMEKAEEQSGKKVSPSVPAEESNVSSSTDVRPQKTSHGPSFGTKGVLRIHLLEAQDLVAKDNMMGGMVKGKSDPYVKIHIRDTTFKSYVIKENLNPTWNEMYEMVLSPDNNLDVKFEVYDKDFESDDFLGRLVHLQPLLLIKAQVMQMQSSQTYQNKSVPSAALLFIYLERAHDLPVCDRSTSPYWNEAFDFLVHDPKKDMLVIKRAAFKTRSTDGPVAQSGWSFTKDNMQTATTGQIKISLFFQKKLTVIIHACSGLVTSSKDSLDTYVSLILLPDKNKATKRKTSVKKKNLNPEFNERFEFDMSVEDAQRRELSVSVKNASSSFMNRDKDLIGQVQIDLGHVDLISGVTEWFVLVTYKYFPMELFIYFVLISV